MILGIETSVDHVGVAVGDYRGIRAHSMLASDRRHAESLTPMIQFVLQQADASMADLSAIAVDVGPGLFTGMRVGIASAASLAWALELPVVPVCSLDALAMNAEWSDNVVAASLDARRGEVYWSLYRYIDGKLRQVTTPKASTVEECALQTIDRGQSTLFVGNGALRYRNEIELVVAGVLPSFEFADEMSSLPTAVVLAQIAHERALRQDWQEADTLVPEYLRLPDAEINWATRSAS